MIYGIGTDIIDINRIRNTLEKYDKRFKNKCFHKNEIIRSDKIFNHVSHMLNVNKRSMCKL